MELEKQIFNEVWFFFKKYYNVREDDAFWAGVIRAADEIMEKYNDELATNLLLAIVGHLERLQKAKFHPGGAKHAKS